MFNNVLWVENSPVTHGFPSRMVKGAICVSTSCRHYDYKVWKYVHSYTRNMTVCKCYGNNLGPRTQTKRSFCPTSVRLQNLPWYKTGFESRQFLHLLSKLQNWICPKTGQCKTCIVSNTKIETSIWATKPKPCQWHLTSQTVEIFIQMKRQV